MGTIVLYCLVGSSRQNAECNLPCFVYTNTCVYKCTYLYYNILYACTFRIKYARGPKGSGLKVCFFEKFWVFFFCKVLYFFFLKYFKLVKHRCLSRMWLASDWDWAEAAPPGRYRYRCPIARQRLIQSEMLGAPGQDPDGSTA